MGGNKPKVRKTSVDNFSLNIFVTKNICVWRSLLDDKDCLSVCSHFSCSDDDELIIRKGPCQINLKKTATKKSTAERMTWQLSGTQVEKRESGIFRCGNVVAVAECGDFSPCMSNVSNI